MRRYLNIHALALLYTQARKTAKKLRNTHTHKDFILVWINLWTQKNKCSLQKAFLKCLGFMTNPLTYILAKKSL